MASLYISEYERVAKDVRGTQMPAGHEPSITVQKIPVSAISTQSAALSERTHLVRVHADVPCSIAWGENPEATLSHARLAANQTEYFGVHPGDKLAVILNS